MRNSFHTGEVRWHFREIVLRATGRGFGLAFQTQGIYRCERQSDLPNVVADFSFGAIPYRYSKGIVLLDYANV